MCLYLELIELYRRFRMHGIVIHCQRSTTKLLDNSLLAVLSLTLHFTVPDDYGIDPDAPNPDAEDLSIVTVPEIRLPLSHQSLQHLSISGNPLDQNVDGQRGVFCSCALRVSAHAG